MNFNFLTPLVCMSYLTPCSDPDPTNGQPDIGLGSTATLALSEVGKFLKDSLNAWVDDRASSMGASLAYYTLFSIAPLLLIVIAVAGTVFGKDAASGAIYTQLASILGKDGALAVQGLIASVQANQQSGWGAALGIGLMILGATTVVAELEASMNVIWRAPKAPARPGWFLWLRTRFLSFSLVLGMGFLLIVSLVISALVAVWGAWWAPWFSNMDSLLQLANFLIGLALSVVMFAMIYKLMPAARVAWRDVWVGSVITAVLFAIGKTLIGLYIGTSGIASGFGAASSLIVVIVWVYYSAQVFLIGAEMTWVYAKRWGSLSKQYAQPTLSAIAPN
jgi:membrane protein